MRTGIRFSAPMQMAHNTCSFSSKRPSAVFWTPRIASHTCVHTYTHPRIFIYNCLFRQWNVIISQPKDQKSEIKTLEELPSLQRP